MNAEILHENRRRICGRPSFHLYRRICRSYRSDDVWTPFEGFPFAGSHPFMHIARYPPAGSPGYTLSINLKLGSHNRIL